jgi:hypothetical protein
MIEVMLGVGFDCICQELTVGFCGGAGEGLACSDRNMT